MATLYGILAVLLWGLLALLGLMTKGIAPFQLLFLCFSLSAAIMLFSRALRGQPILRTPRLCGTQWLVGILGLFGFHFSYFTALKLAPAIEVSLIVYLWPLLLSVLVAKRGRRLNAALGGALGFLGIATIITNGSLSLDSSALPGYLLAALCALIWAGYSWYLSKTTSEVEDIGWQSLVVAVLALIAHLSLEPGDWQFTSAEWLGIALLGLGPVGGAFYLWDMGLKRGNRQLLASLSFSAPLISAVALAVAGYNQWSMDIIIALSLIMLGAWVANRRAAPAKLSNSTASTSLR